MRMRGQNYAPGSRESAEDLCLSPGGMYELSLCTTHMHGVGAPACICSSAASFVRRTAAKTRARPLEPGSGSAGGS